MRATSRRDAPRTPSADGRPRRGSRRTRDLSGPSRRGRCCPWRGRRGSWLSTALRRRRRAPAGIAVDREPRRVEVLVLGVAGGHCGRLDGSGGPVALLLRSGPEDQRDPPLHRRARQASGGRLVPALPQVEVRMAHPVPARAAVEVEELACPGVLPKVGKHPPARPELLVAWIGGVRRFALASRFVEISGIPQNVRRREVGPAVRRPAAQEVFRPIVGFGEVPTLRLEVEEVLRGLGEVGIERQRAFDRGARLRVGRATSSSAHVVVAVSERGPGRCEVGVERHGAFEHGERLLVLLPDRT